MSTKEFVQASGSSDEFNQFLYVAIAKNYKKVETSEKLIGNAGHDLALCKFYLTLEEFYLSENFDTKTFLTKLNKYDFDFNNDFLLALETGMHEQLSKEEFNEGLRKCQSNYYIPLLKKILLVLA